MPTKTQHEIIDRKWLYSQGWTVRAAARRIKRSPQQVSRALMSNRGNAPTVRLLLDLPARDLILRERLTPAH